MNNLDILGYYVTKFSQIEIQVILAIMGSNDLGGSESFDITINDEKMKLRKKLSEYKFIEESDLNILMNKIKKQN